MLNLSQIQQQVKTQQPAFVANAPNLRSFVGISLAYRELKRLGWHSLEALHEVDRVPVFQLGNLDAYIWRDKSLEYDWFVQVKGNIYGWHREHLAGITADVRAEAEGSNLTAVTYDRPHNEWVAGDERFPGGPVGKRQAQLHALRSDVSAVAAEVEAIIDTATELYMFDREGITRRAIKAGFLVRDGKVWPGEGPGEIARVNGTADQPYRIISDGETCHCDCPDYIGDRAPVLPNGNRGCKHIIAVTIAAALADSPLLDGDGEDF